LWLGSKIWRFFEGQLPDDVTKAFLTARNQSQGADADATDDRALLAALDADETEN